MKKEIEIEMGVFVPLKKETEDIPRALKNAGEILHRVLAGAYVPPDRAYTKEEPTKGSAGVKGQIPAPKRAAAVSAIGLDSIVQGQILPQNRSFRTQLNIAGDRQNIENSVLEQFSLQLSDRQEAITAGMEATLKIQKKILRAVQGMHLENIRDMHKTASAEGGVL